MYVVTFLFSGYYFLYRFRFATLVERAHYYYGTSMKKKLMKFLSAAGLSALAIWTPELGTEAFSVCKSVFTHLTRGKAFGWKKLLLNYGSLHRSRSQMTTTPCSAA